MSFTYGAPVAHLVPRKPRLHQRPDAAPFLSPHPWWCTASPIQGLPLNLAGLRTLANRMCPSDRPAMLFLQQEHNDLRFLWARPLAGGCRCALGSGRPGLPHGHIDVPNWAGVLGGIHAELEETGYPPLAPHLTTLHPMGTLEEWSVFLTKAILVNNHFFFLLAASLRFD